MAEKGKGKGKKTKKTKKDDDDYDEDDDAYTALSKSMWSNSAKKPAVGSFENCVKCEKKFTVVCGIGHSFLEVSELMAANLDQVYSGIQ